MLSNWLSPARASITTRLLLWFLAISLIPCGLLTAINTYLSLNSLRRSVKSKLLSISASKTTQLESFVRQCRGDVAVLGQAPRTVQTTEELSRALAKGTLTEAVRQQKEKTYHAIANHYL